ncbi:universal stress protein [Curtobacterium sp. VKM Ac-1393]|uniref:universal stress protein n=1 Tax=Curtobacterium sp. VKM Ac-1393 TaxID=2783814 RepID=UPI00188A4416|nr:universal stress protein [Curtobacterium sp. VKM Ac-1393]MBF4609411.1 universal stress protein [Curtobacterium sp. VKM Ac-1393]
MDKRYLVGFDDSGPSRRALEWVKSRAADEHAPIVLVHVWSGGPDADEDDGVLAARQALRAARERHPEADLSLLVLEGDVVGALLDVVDPDTVLVIGTHKTGHLHGRSLGTTGLVLATAAPCTVVVVPDVDLRFRRGVVAGVGAGADAADVGEMAASEAVRRGEELVLIRAKSADATGAEDLAAAGRRLQDAHPRLTVSCRTTGRAVAPTLLDAAFGHALLVIGGRQTSGIRAGHVSAVLHDVLINLTAPVLVARHDDGRGRAAAPLTKETV